MVAIMVPVDEKVFEQLEPVLEDMGFELVDVEYLSRHEKWVWYCISTKRAV